MVIVIDGNIIRTEELFHKKLKEVFNFPNYYGENFDALWDMFTAWIEYPLFLVIKNYEPLSENMGDKFNVLIKVLEQAEIELEGFNYIMIPSINLENDKQI